MFKVLKYLKPYTIFIIFVVIFTTAQALLQLRLPTIMADMVEEGYGIAQTSPDNPDFQPVWSKGIMMLVVTALSMFFTILGSYFAAKASIGLGKILRSKIFRKVETFSLNEFDKFGTSTLVTRSTNDIMQIQQLTFMLMRMIVLSIVTSAGGIYYALSTDLKLSGIFLVVVPVMAFAIIIIGSKAVPLFKAMQKKLDKLNLVSREGLTGVRVVRAFNRTEHEKRRFHEANESLTDTAIRANKLIALLMPIIFLVMNLMTVSILWFGTKRFDNSFQEVIPSLKQLFDGIQAGTIDPSNVDMTKYQPGFSFANIMAFIQYSFQVMFALLNVAVMFVIIPRAQASAERINEVLVTEPSIFDVKTHSNKNVQKRGYVTFKDVTFKFHGAEEPAIQNISFQSNSGEVTAIIGGTGSGKSTIINMIPRFYDVKSGEVLVDGKNVKDYTQDELRKKIGFVPQKAVLFTGSIADNIRYGKKDASTDEIKHAAQVAQATEFIHEMKDGYDSMIAQGGTNVSGGQKQRLSIARAIIRKPEIYIFDDSFSALDFKTDAKLRMALKDETKNSTVIIVAQRVSTIMNADRILVLEQGKIVGNGRHKELLETCETYREIASSQLSEEELS